MKLKQLLALTLVSISLMGARCSDDSIGNDSEEGSTTDKLAALEGTWTLSCFQTGSGSSKTEEYSFDDDEVSIATTTWNNETCDGDSASSSTVSGSIIIGDDVNTSSSSSADATEIDIETGAGDSADVLYTIYQINTAGTILYFGELVEGGKDGSSSFNRPDNIEFDESYDKQP